MVWNFCSATTFAFFLIPDEIGFIQSITGDEMGCHGTAGVTLCAPVADWKKVNAVALGFFIAGYGAEILRILG